MKARMGKLWMALLTLLAIQGTHSFPILMPKLIVTSSNSDVSPPSTTIHPLRKVTIPSYENK